MLLVKRLFRRKVVIMLFIIIGIILIGFFIMLINSPGKPAPLKDEQGNGIEGSISEKVWLEIGGMKQGMFLRGENPQNPVLLYLHGGPGTPMLQFVEYMEKGDRLEKYFTVCYWDQRGAGMTYTKSMDSSTMTIAQMVEDTREVTEYLKSRFAQEKIYLMGHSGGSYLGVKTIEKYPENYLAYIGIGQVTNQTESERLAYAYLLNRAKETDDREVVDKLEKYDPQADDFPWFDSLEYLAKVRTDVLIKYGVGHIHEFPQGIKTYNQAILKTLFTFKGYTLREKINWFLGADFSMIHLFPVILKDDLFVSSTEFAIPFYVAQGAYDYQVSAVLAEKYLHAIDAPKKEFFLFENSAHSPNLEEPEKFIEILRGIAKENPPVE